MFNRPLYFTNVTILTAAGPIGHALRIKGKAIIGIDSPPRKNDHVIDGGGGLLIPGLINAHDHLELNTFQRLKYRETYTHSRAWIEDIEDRFDDDPELTVPRQQPLADRLLIGAVKNLLSGVTTVCHHNPLHKPLRRNYPLRVVTEYGFCHSLFRGDDAGTSYRETNRNHPWIIHLAEGVDAEAAAEFDQLDRRGLLQSNTVLVHGVGLTPAQRRALVERGGGLIWCPGSNDFLFGQTACVSELAQAGKLALGSDSRLSGEFDLLAELRIAHETGQLSPRDLFQLVTNRPARLLQLRTGGQGQIVEGGPADFVLLPPPSGTDPFAHLLSLARADLDLVMLAGKPVVGSPRMRPGFTATKTKAISVWVDQVEKLLAQHLAQRLQKSSVQEPGLSLTAPLIR